MVKSSRVVSKNFGSIIKFSRENKNLSLKELEDKTGISASYINRLENGERQAPSVPIASELADALELDLAMLLDVCNNKSKSDDLISIAELLLMNDFKINGVNIGKEAKELIVSLIEKIINAEWDVDTKMQDVYEIGILIDAYKRAYKND